MNYSQSASTLDAAQALLPNQATNVSLPPLGYSNFSTQNGRSKQINVAERPSTRPSGFKLTPTKEKTQTDGRLHWAYSRKRLLQQDVASVFLNQHKPLWNATAIGYTLLGYSGGVALLLLSNLLLNLLGVFLITHSLVISAYMSHEFMHCTIFRTQKLNILGGQIMLWLNGHYFARFRELTKHHVAHHVKRADIASSDLPAFLNRLPVIVRGIILGLEWLYFPAISFIAQWESLINIFFNPKRRPERVRVGLLLSLRVALFAILGIVSLKALLLYFVAYVGMITVLRVVDAFQHNYEVCIFGEAAPKRDFQYEQSHTFSPLLSRRFWWVNLLLLNFGYHNAHHTLMKCAWHSLHELDEVLGLDEDANYVPMWQALVNYHRFRISRIFADPADVLDRDGKLQMKDFQGGVGISFLVELHA